MMPLNLIGKEFHYLTVLKGESRKKTLSTGFILCRKYWFCRCVCGATKWARSDALVKGHTTSCGCMRGYAKRDQPLVKRPHRPRIRKAMNMENPNCRDPAKPRIRKDTSKAVVTKPLPGVVAHNPSTGPSPATIRTIIGARLSHTPWRDVAELANLTVEECKQIVAEHSK